MDTRFWGPSGWRLLHLISFRAPELQTSSLRSFFELLPYILPCKYCRASFADYITADPIPAANTDFAPWLYRIHNRVNGKLRDQKLLTESDPSWSEIESRYRSWLRAPCSTRNMVGWDFLFSAAYTTPGAGVASKPMPGAPPRRLLTTPALLNRWNMLSREARIPYITRWWRLIPAVLPFAEWREAWASVARGLGPPPVAQGRHKMTAWLYKMECGICAALKKNTPHESFGGLCSELSTFTSGCGKAKRGKTCRATKRAAHRRLTLRRRYRAQEGGGL